PIMLKREITTADPAVVWLVPDAPIPIAHHLAAPLVDAATDDVSGPLGERLDQPRIVERRLELGKSHHRLCADVQDSLHVSREQVPLLQMVGRTFVEKEKPYNARIDFAESCPDALTVRPHRKIQTLVCLVHPILKFHPLLARADNSHVNLHVFCHLQYPFPFTQLFTIWINSRNRAS